MDYFTDIIGQERALLPLQKALQTGKINHAYLFVGPAGIGKFTAAQDFARAIIIGTDPQGEAYVKEKVHPDFMVVEKLESKTLIGIEQINREMEPWLALKPYRSSRRVVIIKDAHLLSIPAANALLKTLEEPPGHAVIILVSDEQNLLETIISRCQVIRFFPLAEVNISEFLLRRGVEPDRANNLARLGQGSMAAALLMAEEAGLEEFWDTAQTLIKNLATGQEIEVFKCAEQMEKKPAMLASLMSTLVRDIYIYQVTDQKQLLMMKSSLKLCEDFKKLVPIRVHAALGNIDKLRKQYRGPVSSLLISINISYQLWDALQ
jgi:DNA polymerase-3 subunit delta'